MIDDQQTSRIGVDGLGPNLVEPVDSQHSHKMPIVSDLVGSGAGARASGVGNGLPFDGDGVTDDGSLAVDDGSGDDPLHDHVVGVGTGTDRHPPGVLGADGVDTVDDVRTEHAVLGELSGGETGDGEQEDTRHPGETTHVGESKKRLGPISKAALSLVSVLVIAVMAFAIFEPVQVLPRMRIAPGFALVDQFGATLTSEDGRGVVTLYGFVPTTCGEECDVIHETMAEVGDRAATEVDLGGAEFRRVTVALDTADPSELAEAAQLSGADGESWRWVGAEPDILKAVVGGGFGVYYEESGKGDLIFDQTYVIADGTGLVRGESQYATLASDADRLTRHIGLLGNEIRNSDGNNKLIYEAAHIFLCYP